MKEISIYKYPAREEWEELTRRAELDIEPLMETTKSVIDDVRRNGDEAVRRYEVRFDKVKISDLQVSANEIKDAESRLPVELKEAIKTAALNIRRFHSAQVFDDVKVETMPGVVCSQRAVAIEKVGIYVPGGTAPLFSTVLMLAIPARIAGCDEIVLCSPPTAGNGRIHPAVLYAAKVAGVSKIFKAGGIQAIAAMAYGTESVPRVYKIFGPGNQYVTAAKQLVGLKDVAIDMPAGPSEALIIADRTASPAYLAADFLSQAEHGTDSQSILLTTSEQIAEEVVKEIYSQMSNLPRRKFIEQSLENSKIIVMHRVSELIDFSNQYAPEHLIIQTKNYNMVAERIINAGSVFLGPYTPESAGDYASGTNHTLPTKGYARMYSGVNLDSFVRKVTFQEITADGLRQLAPTIETMAKNENLHAHKNAVSIRLKKKYGEN